MFLDDPPLSAIRQPEQLPRFLIPVMTLKLGPVIYGARQEQRRRLASSPCSLPSSSSSPSSPATRTTTTTTISRRTYSRRQAGANFVNFVPILLAREKWRQLPLATMEDFAQTRRLVVILKATFFAKPKGGGDLLPGFAPSTGYEPQLAE